MHDGYKVNRQHLNFEVLAQRTQGLCTKNTKLMHDGYKVNRQHLNFEVLAQRTQGLCTMDTKLIESILILKY
jgi:hypothetical protein